MAELTAFGYNPGRSLLHRLDPRFKLACLAAVNLAVLGAGVRGTLIAAAAGLGGMFWAGPSIRSVLRETRYFSVILVFIVVARALTTPGTPIFGLPNLPLTVEGISDGGRIGLRLATLVVWGLLFISVTPAVHVRGAVVLILRPVPFIPEQRVGTLLGLMFRFIPLIAGQVRRTADALKARGVEARKNPLVRTRYLVLPLLRRTFEDADRLIIAMTSRGYTENRSLPEFRASFANWMALAAVAAGCGAILSL